MSTTAVATSSGSGSGSGMALSPFSPPLHFSFAAAGWLKMYYFGVAKALQAHGLHLGQSRFAGASAGSLVATALVLNRDFDAIRQYALQCAARVRAHPAQAFSLRQFLEAIVDHQLDDVSHEEIADRVHVAVTRLPLIATRYSRFRDKEHLRQALLASCCMSPLAGMPFKLDGYWVFDGGMSDFQPVFDNVPTVTISAFYFSTADIRPSQYVPAWWGLYPPALPQLERLFNMGLHDAHVWVLHKCKIRSMPLLLKSAPAPRKANKTPVDTPTSTTSTVSSVSAFIPTPPSVPPPIDPLRIHAEVLQAAANEEAIKSRPLVSFFSKCGSVIVDLFLYLFINAVLKPLCFLALYIELLILAGLHLLRAILQLFTLQFQSAAVSWKLACKYATSAMSLRLAFRSIPLIGRLMPINVDKLHRLSFFFRVGVHIL